MSAPMVRTRHPGIYRRGSRYVVRYRADGKHRTESARTLDEARRLLDRRRSQVAEGDYREPTRDTLAEYARQWIDAYQGGRPGAGFRETTREEYRRDLERYVIPFLGPKRLTALRRSDVKAFVAWLVDDEAQMQRHQRENTAREDANAARKERGEKPLKPLRDPRPLRDGTVARIVAVLSACLRSALDDELRRDNPAAGVKLPRRDAPPTPTDDEDVEGVVKALTRAELAAFLLIVHRDWRTFFRLLAATGLRISEALALDVRHLVLDGSRPHVKVRRAFTPRGGMGHPKSDHGVRDVPLPDALVHELRAHVNALPDAPAAAVERWGRLAFASSTGTPMRAENLRRRVLKPAAEEADVAWTGFHAFRHTFASMHIERGTNIVRVSRLLGHHSPEFTLRVYAHLLDDGMGAPLDLDAEIASVAATSENIVRTCPTANGDTTPDALMAQVAA